MSRYGRTIQLPVPYEGLSQKEKRNVLMAFESARLDTEKINEVKLGPLEIRSWVDEDSFFVGFGAEVI